MFFNDILDDIFQTLLERKKSSGSGGEDLFKPYVDGTLTELTAKDLKGLTEIPDECFKNSTLTSVELPYGVTSIGEDAFYYASAIRTLVLPDSIRSIGKSAFYETRVTDFFMGKGVVNIGTSAFTRGFITNLYYNGDFTSWHDMNFSESGTQPMNNASYVYFRNTSGDYELLTEIVIPDSITEIKPYEFYHCNCATSLVIHDSVTTIGDYGFGSLYHCENVVVGRGLTSISNNGLYCGNSTTGVYATLTFLGTTPPSIQSNSLNSRNTRKIIVPKGCGEAYKTATNWTRYADKIEEAAE